LIKSGLKDTIFKSRDGKSNASCKEWIDDMFWIWAAEWAISILMVLIHHWIEEKTDESFE